MLYTPLELIIELHRQYTRQNVVVLRKDVDDCIQRMIAGRRHPLRFLHKKIKTIVGIRLRPRSSAAPGGSNPTAPVKSL